MDKNNGATVRMTLTLHSGEQVVSYWKTASDAIAWRKMSAASWHYAKLERV